MDEEQARWEALKKEYSKFVRCDDCPIMFPCPHSEFGLSEELSLRLWPRHIYEGGGFAYRRDPVSKAEEVAEYLRVATENCPLLALVKR